MHISSQFDSGNIEVLDASDPGDIRLSIRNDAGDEHKQWFHFRAVGGKDQPCVFRIVNAKDCSYPKAWEGYQAVVSADREEWVRVETEYVDGELIIRHTPLTDSIWVAYFAPYTREQHRDLVAQCQSAGARLEVLGTTLDGEDLDLLTIGEGPLPVWVIARQHPGESMAEWWMDGFLGRLLDPDDALTRRCLELATFYVVPNMNPDGSRRGHLRVNAVGANLNREWHEPTLERSPEVKLVRDRMDQTGVGLCLDVHGDEELPYNFISGAEGVPSWSEAREAVQTRFEVAYEVANPDFQRVHGYGRTAPGQANMSMCTNQVAERFPGSLAMTLEMPFKDNDNAPDALFGWSPERCSLLGATALNAMIAVFGELG